MAEVCGIVGFWNLRLGDESFINALAAMAHRGPDASAWKIGSTGGTPVYLGHRRLSIIDLSDAANQPFEKDGLTIVFNGEIYNYKELRAELESRGTQFTTASDTEVLLEAFRHWGDDCYRKLRGMFAFAILDERKNRLTLARDPFGIKPLYVYKGPSGAVAFASEMKALFAAGIPADINPDAITTSVLLYFLPEDVPSFRNIDKLSPGTFLHITAAGMEFGRYFDAKADLWENRPAPVTTDELRAVLEDSIAAHMIADVPVSTFLSGGLDSSLITTLAARHNPRLEAFTISLRGKDLVREAMPQDVTFARKLAQSLGIKLHEIEVSPKIVDWLPKMVATLEEPIGDPATINVMLMCQAARSVGAKVLLSGMGADEIFGGYRRHQALMLSSFYRRLPSIARKGIAAASQFLPVAAFGHGITPVRWAKRYLAFANIRNEADAYLRSYSYYDRRDLMRLLPAIDVRAADSIAEKHRSVFEDLDQADLPTRMGYTDLHYFLPALNLTYTDRASMFASTEVRVPFVDRDVVRAAFSLPGPLKNGVFSSKVALRKAAEAWLPREIVYRPKASFGVPLRAWMHEELSDPIKALAHDSRLVRDGYVDANEFEVMIADFEEDRVDNSYQLWHLLVLEQWLGWAKGQHVNAPSAKVLSH